MYMYQPLSLYMQAGGPRVSFASTTTTISSSHTPYTSPTHHTPHTHTSSRGSDDLTTVSKLLSVSSTNGDEVSAFNKFYFVYIFCFAGCFRISRPLHTPH